MRRQLSLRILKYSPQDSDHHSLQLETTRMGLTERELCPSGQFGGLVAAAPRHALPWFAITIKPHHEKAVQEGLDQKGLETFLPLYWATRRWSDRVKRLQLPLFSGYVFCRFDAGIRTPVLRTPGVRSIVSFGSDPLPVADFEIERIQRILASGAGVEPWPFLKVGQRVRVGAGALAGLEGILAEVRNTWRVVVNLELLQRSVAVQLDRDSIVPLSN
jgi:transcription antitermination factor NusG